MNTNLTNNDKKILVSANALLFFMIIILGALSPVYKSQFYFYSPSTNIGGFDYYYTTAYLIALFATWFTLWFFYIWTLVIGIVQKNNFYICLFMLPFISTLKWNRNCEYKYKTFLFIFSVSYIICTAGLIVSTIIPFFIGSTKVNGGNYVGQLVVSSSINIVLIIGLSAIYGTWVGSTKWVLNLVSAETKAQLPIRQSI